MRQRTFAAHSLFSRLALWRGRKRSAPRIARKYRQLSVEALEQRQLLTIYMYPLPYAETAPLLDVADGSLSAVAAQMVCSTRDARRSENSRTVKPPAPSRPADELYR